MSSPNRKLNSMFEAKEAWRRTADGQAARADLAEAALAQIEAALSATRRGRALHELVDDVADALSAFRASQI